MLLGSCNFVFAQIANIKKKYLFMSLCSSRYMPELRFAITQQQKSVFTGCIYGPLTQLLATLIVLAEGSLTQASIQTPSQPFSGWMSKPALPVWRLGVPTDPCIQKAWIILHSFFDSVRYIHLYDRDLLSLFKWLVWLTTWRIQWFLIPCPGTHTPTAFLIQQSWVINFELLLGWNVHI